MIYDEFVKDEEWQRLNQALHVPGLTYRERDALRGALDVREDAIRKRESEKFKKLCEEYKHHENTGKGSYDN